jgi:hypothetical protein
MQQIREQESAELKSAQTKQSLAIRQMQELQREKQEAANAENRLRLRAIEEEALRRRAAAADAQRAELAHKNAIVASEVEGLNAKVRYEQSISNARLQALTKENSVIAERCRIKENSADQVVQYEAQAARSRRE